MENITEVCGIDMGKIKDKLIEVQEYLERGCRPESVAAVLSVPIDWVWQIYEKMELYNEYDQEGA